ncbi:putative Ribonucleotide reductase [uncultured Gammaproteobacteria bacterium]
MTRERLPNRRPNETTTLVFGGMSFSVTIGVFPDGRPGEVFASGAKIGCDLDYLLDDACVALSLLLQHGVEPAALVGSMGRAGDGATPASIIGALADRLAEVRP